MSYWKAKSGGGGGETLYIAMYNAFYLPGLPVAHLQRALDARLDRYVGSSWWTTWWRGAGSLTMVAVAVLLYTPVADSGRATVVLTLVLGTFTWLAHGTLSTLCAIFDPSHWAWMQTGFRSPEILGLALSGGLRLGHSPSVRHLEMFFVSTFALAAAGLAAFVSLMRSEAAVSLLAAKDAADAADARRDGGRQEQTPLVGVGGGGHDGPPEKPSSVGPGSRPPLLARYRVALFLTIYASVFQGGFFVYCTSSSGVNIEQILYFTRLFADLAGRPLARYIRPPWLVRSPSALASVAAARLSLMGAYFAYIFSAVPRSDAFVVALVVVFSVMSGYLVVLVYEGAAAAQVDEAGKAEAGRVMNLTFHQACVSAVVTSVCVAGAVGRRAR